MKKIGFIDYYIDEWHANNYPRMIRESKFGDRFEVAMAWEEMTPQGKKTIDQWCEEQNVRKATGIAEVVEGCDCIVVLSPDNAERHEDLADLPLMSGKPVYIDKPVAPSRAAAQRLFEKAEKYNTPMMSSSALRFGSPLQAAAQNTIKDGHVHFVATRGGGRSFRIYSIHQIEMLVTLLGVGAKCVMQCGKGNVNIMLVDYQDDRRGIVTFMPGHTFQFSVAYNGDSSLYIDKMDDFFPRFIDAMLAFFDTGQSPVPKEQTLEVAAIMETGNAALEKADTWVPITRE